MRIRFPFGYNQVLLAVIPLLFVSLFSGCRRTSDELPVTPPATYPLTREYLGYGVVNVSFTHLLNEPGSGGISQGYLRRGTVVRVMERRHVSGGDTSETWILAEGNYGEPDSASRGWLLEANVNIYESESRAETASKSMRL